MIVIKNLTKYGINTITEEKLAREVLGFYNPAGDLTGKFTHCFRQFFTTELRRAGYPLAFIQKLRGDVWKEAIGKL
ncbi:hypothetical protein ACSAZK_03810 [Methanosarcina sp. Mfa9]|uniref:hypothetical protein n=1 Tax=Methanosarcina sp. Mfa9 TaxID=3439063 RepID=UPI003F85663B